MQKNEKDLIEPWIIYHANLFGLTNLYVYDNGSTEPNTLTLLKKYEKQGLNVDYSRSTKQDFESKGRIISSRIKELEKNQYDFFFPLDCDEFIACIDKNGQISLTFDSIKSTLLPFKDDPRVLAIQRAYDNSPMHFDYYLPREDQRKCFFANGACAELDIGFHQGKAKTTIEQLKIPIIYFHFHHKPYIDFQESSREKLTGRVVDFTEETLLEHFKSKKPGFHLIPRLLMSKNEYNSQFSINHRIHYPNLNKTLRSLGATFPPDHPAFTTTKTALKGRGYVDTIKIDSNLLQICGWAITEDGTPAQDLRVILDGEELPIWELHRINREDVAKAEKDSSINCGFLIKTTLPINGSKLEIIVRESQTNTARTLLLGESAKIEWMEIQNFYSKNLIDPLS